MRPCSSERYAMHVPIKLYGRIFTNMTGKGEKAHDDVITLKIQLNTHVLHWTLNFILAYIGILWISLLFIFLRSVFIFVLFDALNFIRTKFIKIGTCAYDYVLILPMLYSRRVSVHMYSISKAAISFLFFSFSFVYVHEHKIVCCVSYVIQILKIKKKKCLWTIAIWFS